MRCSMATERAEPREATMRAGRSTRLLRRLRVRRASGGKSGAPLGYLLAKMPTTDTKKILAIAERAVRATWKIAPEDSIALSLALLCNFRRWVAQLASRLDRG